MCPVDPTPHFGEVLQKPEKQFPKPTPDVTHEDKPQADEADESIAGRPEIPTSSEIKAVDIEDEDADPVIESGPVDKRQTSLFTKD